MQRGLPSAVVVLGLTNGNACIDGPPPNLPDIEPTEFIEFIEKFGDRGLRGLVCGTAEDYVSFFEMAVGTIEQACDEFVPPG